MAQLVHTDVTQSAVLELRVLVSECTGRKPPSGRVWCPGVMSSMSRELFGADVSVSVYVAKALHVDSFSL